MRQAIEMALSLALEDAGISKSDLRWERLLKNTTSEAIRQMRKGNQMDPDITELFDGSNAGTQALVLKHILQEQRRTREALEKLLQPAHANGNGNGAARVPSKIERVRA
jgi:hypothetical protein